MPGVPVKACQVAAVFLYPALAGARGSAYAHMIYIFDHVKPKTRAIAPAIGSTPEHNFVPYQDCALRTLGHLGSTKGYPDGVTQTPLKLLDIFEYSRREPGLMA